MFQAPEQLATLNKTNMEAAARLTSIALEGIERMFELNLKASKSAFGNIVLQTKAIAEIKDVQELAQLKNTFEQPMMENLASYAKSVYDVAVATQSEINKLVEEQAAEFKTQTVTSLDKVLKSAPAGSEVAVAAVKSVITAVNSVYDNLSKSAKQFSEISQANVEAATTQAVHATKKKKSDFQI
jgi:phasin family protein